MRIPLLCSLVMGLLSAGFSDPCQAAAVSTATQKLQALSPLSALNTSIVDAAGAAVTLRGVNLGSWIYNESWISAIDYPLHGRLAVLGEQTGLSIPVKETLIELGPFESGSEAEYLAAFETALSTRVSAAEAQALTEEALDYPLLYDDADLKLLDMLEQTYGLDGREAIYTSFLQSWITQFDIQFIAGLGMNVVRVPMGYRMLLDLPAAAKPTAPLRFRASTFQALDQLLSWCEQAGIYAVLDIQEAPGGQNEYSGPSTLYTDPEMQQLTVELWLELSRRYKSRNVVAAYSLLAEPYSAPDVETMMAMYDKLYDAIRATGDNHLLVIHDGFKGMNKLPAPSTYGWKNVLYSTHLFEWGAKPYAAWKTVIKATETAFKKAQAKQNVPYFVGSFSTMYDEDAAYRAFRDYLTTFDTNKWSWAMWTYKRIDDPLEYEYYGTTTAWGIWQRLNETADWQRADVYLDGESLLVEKLSGYTTDKMLLNNRLYTLLSDHLRTSSVH